MNMSTLRGAVAYKVGMSTTDSVEAERLLAWLNEGYEDVLVRTRCKVSCADLALTVNEWKYTLPTSILSVLEVWIEQSADGRVMPFERTSSEHIIRLRAGTAVATGSPVRYYALEGSDLLMVWPTPSVADTLELLYVPRPTPLSATGDIPSYVPAEWHKSIELYASWQAGDYTDDGSSGIGEAYRVQYEGPNGMGGYLRRIRLAIRHKGGRRLGPARVGRRWGQLVPHARDQSMGW
jgi:hypothetical protein